MNSGYYAGILDQRAVRHGVPGAARWRSRRRLAGSSPPGATFLVGIGIQHYGSIGVTVALTAIPFVMGLMLLPFSIETRGKPLPV
jgi:hypothetical protein